MFQLDNKMVKINGLKIRNETDDQGEDHGVVDIAISAPMENDVLDKFHDKLKSAFYEGDGQTDLVSGERLTKLRLPFPRFPWKGTLEGYTFVGHTGTGGPSEIKLPEADINNVQFLLKDKAAVDMDYMVRARAAPEDIAKLSKLIGKEVHISLVPPTEQEQFQQDQAKKSRRQKLEEQFAGGGQQDDETGDLIDDGSNQVDSESDPVDADEDDLDPPVE